jgi:hypothetical protein
MTGSVILIICITLYTIGIAVDTTASNNLALAMMVLFQLTLGAFWTAIPWIYPPEITPLNLRHIGSAIGPFSEWLCTFIIVQITPTAIENTGWRIYLLFIFMTTIGLFWVYFFVPEVSLNFSDLRSWIQTDSSTDREENSGRDRLHLCQRRGSRSSARPNP